MFKKLKSVFVVDDGNTKVENTQGGEQEVKSSSSSESSKTSPPPSFESKSLDGQSPDPKFIDILLKAIEENNQQGFDYLEYKTSLQSLAKMNMDDATKYQSAMAMAKTMGASSDKILQSANHYLAILKTENDKFQQAVEGQKQKITKDQDAGINQLQSSIVNKQKQIEQLTREIEEAKSSLQKLQQDIASGASKVADTTARFNQAYVVVTQQIVEDIKNISTYAGKI